MLQGRIWVCAKKKILSQKGSLSKCCWCSSIFLSKEITNFLAILSKEYFFEGVDTQLKHKWQHIFCTHVRQIKRERNRYPPKKWVKPLIPPLTKGKQENESNAFKSNLHQPALLTVQKSPFFSLSFTYLSRTATNFLVSFPTSFPLFTNLPSA